ncbi:MAG: efflux RND transporter periplasmic adaptor subunit [Myxococcota bacterium]
MRLPPALLGALAIASLSFGCGDSPLAPAHGAPPHDDAPLEALRVGVRVRTARVRTGQISARDEISGTVHAFHKATITAEAAGRVVQRSVERGEAVELGQVLFRLDASRLKIEVDQALATEKARQTDLRHARRELERGRKLIAQNAISEQRLDDLAYALESAENALSLARVARDRARRALEDATLTTPFAGVVDRHHVDVGDFVSAGTPMLEIVELSRVRLRAGVTAAEAARLSVGLTARATFLALGGAEFAAELRSIGLVADPVNGTYPVEFWLENPGGRLREGMVARVNLPEPDRPPQPLLPRAALIRHEGHMAVFVVEGGPADPRARVRNVRIGHSEGDWVEILEGLSEGERAVVDGHFALSDGAAVIVEEP